MDTRKILFLFLSLIIFISCNEDIINDNEIKDDLSEEYLNAINLVRKFDSDVSPTTKSSESDIKLSLDEVKTIQLNNISTKSGNSLTSDSLNLYIFDLTKNNSQGFAIVCGDQRINKVYAYCSNGSLADTSNILGMAQVISMIPAMTRHDLAKYNNSPSTKSPILPIPKVVYGPNISTQWSQQEPYNHGTPTYGSCSKAYYYAGCGVIAMAQTIAYYGKCTNNYDFDALTAQEQITISSSSYLQNEVSSYISWLGGRLNANYSCSGTSTKIKKCRDVLESMGYSCIYSTSSDVSRDRLFNSISNSNIVLSRGVSGSTGHMWIMDGILVEFTSPYIQEIEAVHCNWGWGGYCDGWYAAPTYMYNKPSDDASDNPTDGYDGDNYIRDYYKDNAYIYINE